MKLSTCLALIAITLPFSQFTLAATEVYVEVDEDGVPNFTDQKLPGAEKIEIREPVTYPGANSQPKARPTQKLSPDSETGVTAYNLLITEPEDGAAIRENSGLLNLTVKITPGLREGHSARLMMDGRPIRPVSSSGQITLSNLDRGTHSFSIQVRDSSNNVIATGPAVSISMLRHSRLHGAN